MTLTQPRIKYIDVRDALITLLRTNVASLNTNLTTAITNVTTQIKKGTPLFQPTYATKYPYVMVDFNRKLEDYQTIGGSARKLATVIFNIYAVVREIAAGGYDDDDEKMYLLDNIESVIRDNPAFSTDILYSRIPETIFEISTANEIYVSGGIISIETQVEVI